MSYLFRKKKAVVLVIVLGVLLIISTLVLASLTLMTQETRLAENKIKRIRAFYAVQAGMVSAIEGLRRTNTVANIVVGAGIPGYPTGGLPVTITRTVGTGISSTDTVTVSVDY
jgi:Tfp pilus assembly protein PilX